MTETAAETKWTVADIARVYGQPLATVETLRSRDPDFPAALGRRGRAFVYAPVAVELWALKRGWRPVSSAPGEPGASGLSRLPDVYTSARAALGCLQALGEVDVVRADPRSLLDELLDERNPWKTQVDLSGIGPILQRSLAAASSADIGDLHDLARAPETWAPDTDDAIASASTDGGRILPTYSSPRLVSWIRAASGRPHGVILDPACGTALLLSAIAAQATDAHLVGLDNDPDAIRVAALRLLAHGRQADLVCGDALSPAGPMDRWSESCDLVVADVPGGLNPEWSTFTTRFGRAPKNEQEFLWLAAAYEALRPGGRAVICTPVKALESPGRAANIRSRLIDEGAIAAVVTLPPGMRPGAAPALALWVLTKQVTSDVRPFLTINAAVLQQELGSTAAQNILSAAIEGFLDNDRRDLASAAGEIHSTQGGLPFGAIRLVVPGRELADSGFNIAPWSPAAQDLAAGMADGTAAQSADRSPNADTDLWTDLVAARDELDAVMQALWERRRDGGEASASVTLAELLRRGDILMFDVRSEDGTIAVSRSWSFPASIDRLPSPGARGGRELAEEPQVGDVAVTRTEQSGVTRFGAVVLDTPDSTLILPAGTRRLLRPDGADSVPAETIAAAINAVASSGWPRGSRGDLDIERATTYIRVPMSGANEIGLQGALHLRDRLDPLLQRLADPSTWT